MLIPSMTGQTPSAPNPATAGGEVTESSQAHSEFEAFLNGASGDADIAWALEADHSPDSSDTLEGEFSEEAFADFQAEEQFGDREDFLLAALAPSALSDDLRTSGEASARKGFSDFQSLPKTPETLKSEYFQNTAVLKTEVLEGADPRIADFETVRAAPSLEEQIFADEVAKEDMDLPEFERFLRSPQDTRHLPEAEPLKAKDVLAQSRLEEVPVEDLEPLQIPTARQSVYAKAGGAEPLEFSMRDLNQVLTRAPEAQAVQTPTSSVIAPLAAEAATARIEAGAALKEASVLQSTQDLPFDIDQVVTRVRTMSNGDTQEITLRMEPEHLGRVMLKVRQTGNELAVEMRVDNPAAKQIIEAGFDTLRNRFLDQEFAYQDLRMNVDVDQRSGSQQQARQEAFHEELVGNIRPGEAEPDPTLNTPRASHHEGGLSVLA
ncbi:MAG: flagellar hook-length control protein FliK [SAR324 cluster bacterium]|nr:flagellar hook-length control protein FliK [SAR324 cluster bacterium]